MNNRRAIVLSIALNLCLAAGAVVAFRSTNTEPGIEPARSRVPSSIIQKVTQTRQVTEPNQIIPLDWRKLESEDYKSYIANLRATGCPEETIRDIIISDINKLYTQKWRQLNPSRDYKYWRYGRSSGEDATREIAARRKLLEGLLREKRELVRALVGVDLVEEGDKYGDVSFRGPGFEAQALEFLPAEKQQLIRQIRDRFEPASQQVMESREPDGFLSADARKRLIALRNEAEAEIRKALTPAEWELFQLHFSNTAQSMRRDMSGLDPTEEEFRRIYALRKAVDQQWEDQVIDRDDKEGQQRRAASYQKLDQDIKEALPADRYAAYKQAQEWEYKEVLGFSRTWDLPKEVASTLYSIRKSAEKQVGELRALKGATDQDRQAAAVALRTETEKSLREALGDKAYASYMRNHAYWLRSLPR
jgi:hypothetical protein